MSSRNSKNWINTETFLKRSAKRQKPPLILDEKHRHRFTQQLLVAKQAK